ncbi:MAG: C40 family peptidase [Planctomycetes bacterium]|nr:C40 family peptidase [Planctomycetota bacterium]
MKPGTFQDLIGVPWAWDGLDPRKALGCYGLLRIVCDRLGLPPFDLADAWRNAYHFGWRGDVVPDGWFVVDDRPQSGDVLVTRYQGIPRHLSYLLDKRRVLTSVVRHGVCILPIERMNTELHAVVRVDA